MSRNLCLELYKLGFVTDDTFNAVLTLFEQQVSDAKIVGSHNLMLKFMLLFRESYTALSEQKHLLLPIFNKWCPLIREPTTTYPPLSKERMSELSLQFSQLVFERKMCKYNDILYPIIKECVQDLYGHITTIEDLPSECSLRNELKEKCKFHNINLNMNQYPEYFGDIHKMITVALCSLDEYTYKSNFKLDPKSVRFMLFADGRNTSTVAYETLCFNGERTFANTFYLDTDICSVPDSISDLTAANANIVYRGRDYELESFEIISAKAAVYYGKSVFYKKDGQLEISLFENLWKYLKLNGLLELSRCDIIGGDLIKVSHLFTVKTIAEGICYHLIKL